MAGWGRFGVVCGCVGFGGYVGLFDFGDEACWFGFGVVAGWVGFVWNVSGLVLVLLGWSSLVLWHLIGSVSGLFVLMLEVLLVFLSYHSIASNKEVARSSDHL